MRGGNKDSTKGFRGHLANRNGSNLLGGSTFPLNLKGVMCIHGAGRGENKDDSPTSGILE